MYLKYYESYKHKPEIFTYLGQSIGTYIVNFRCAIVVCKSQRLTELFLIWPSKFGPRILTICVQEVYEWLSMFIFFKKYVSDFGYITLNGIMIVCGLEQILAQLISHWFPFKLLISNNSERRF